MNAPSQLQLEQWLAGAQRLIAVNHNASGYSFPMAQLSIERGKRYAKIVRTTNGHNSRSVHCFIDLTNGNVLKAATWKAPAKHARGNLNDASGGLSCMGPYGAAYLR